MKWCNHKSQFWYQIVFLKTKTSKTHNTKPIQPPPPQKNKTNIHKILLPTPVLNILMGRSAMQPIFFNFFCESRVPVGVRVPSKPLVSPASSKWLTNVSSKPRVLTYRFYWLLSQIHSERFRLNYAIKLFHQNGFLLSERSRAPFCPMRTTGQGLDKGDVSGRFTVSFEAISFLRMLVAQGGGPVSKSRQAGGTTAGGGCRPYCARDDVPTAQSHLCGANKGTEPNHWPPK